MFLPLPFSSKQLPDGKKLFRRKHGYTHSCTIGSSSKIISVPYNNAKINELELVGAPEKVKISLKILDTPTGTISTIPNYVLNQFGFDVVIAKDFYVDISQYDADVIKNMQIKLEFESPVEFEIGINVVFHEVVPAT